MNFQASQQVAKHLYDIKVQPSTLLPKQIGNMYTASLYAALASVIYNKHNSLVSFVPLFHALMYLHPAQLIFASYTGWPTNYYVLIRQWLDIDIVLIKIARGTVLYVLRVLHTSLLCPRNICPQDPLLCGKPQAR